MEIAKEDKVKCFDFLSEFEKTIKPNFGSYNINDDHLSRFLNENKIFLGKTNKADRAKALKYRYSPFIYSIFYLFFYISYQFFT